MPTTVTPSRRLLEELRAATLESRLKELGILRSFSRPRVSNENPYSETLFRTAKYWPDYPSRPFTNAEEACLWGATFLDWYNHRRRPRGIKFVTPHQRHSGQTVEICRQWTLVYKQARLQNPRRWSRAIRYWHQQEVVWIKPPRPVNESMSVTFAMAT
jgi:putative transposase